MNNIVVVRNITVIRIEHFDGNGIFCSSVRPKIITNGSRRKLFKQFPQSITGFEQLNDMLYRHNTMRDIQQELCPYFEKIFQRKKGFKKHEDVDDFTWANIRQYYCAYRNVYQMKNFVSKPEEYIILKSLGYKIYVIHLKKALRSQYQVFFKKKHIISKQVIPFKKAISAL